jgi:Plasmid pRiA4b ORF-3-like protein
MSVYQLHVSLLEIQPPIWRTLELSSHTTLRQFHRILQIAMGWEEYHLHAFEAGKHRYGLPADSLDPDAPTLPEARFTLADVLPRKGARLLYLYDFGDGWEHEVKLERILDNQELLPPRILAGARRCPPEDCGGPFGYAELLAILSNPRHKRYREMHQWVGPRFHQEAFSPEPGNERLRRNRSLLPKL